MNTTKSIKQTYKGHTITVRLTEEEKPVYCVFIDSVHYSDLSADNEESAIENAEIKIDTDLYDS